MRNWKTAIWKFWNQIKAFRLKVVYLFNTLIRSRVQPLEISGKPLIGQAVTTDKPENDNNTAGVLSRKVRPGIQ